MNLLGDQVHVVVGVLLAAALLGAPWAMARTTRMRWFHYLRNMALVAFASLLVVAAVGLELNRANSWYPTLSDLTGTGAQITTTTTVGARSPSTTFGAGTVNRTDARTLPELPSPGQSTLQFLVPTSVGNRSWPVTVVLPADYFEVSSVHRAYPVLVAAHGVPGSSTAFQTSLPLTALSSPLLAQRKLSAFITVIPEVTPGGLDTECIAGPDSANQMETWLSKDVPEFVTGHLRVIQNRAAWAWVGYSAGGWCSAVMPMLHSNRFGAGLVLGGYFHAWWGPTSPKVPAGTSARLNLVKLAGQAYPPVALFVQSSRHDPDSWPTTRPFLARVRAPMLVRAEVLAGGGHNFSTWTRGLVDGLQWLGETVPGFRP